MSYRLVPGGCALALFLAMTALYLTGHREAYEAIIAGYGVVPFRFPFVDISGSLAAWECARQGIDVVIADPCDVLQRGYNYSPLWMSFAAIPLGVADTARVGWGLGLCFILSLILLPPARRPLELAVVLGATLSTMVVFAVERANPDILLFMLALATGFLVEGRPAVRLVGYAVAVLAALLKYYPVMLLIVLLRERPRPFLAIAGAIAAVVCLFWATYHVDVMRGLPTIAVGPYTTDLFAAKNLPSLSGEIVQTTLQPSVIAAWAGRATAWLFYALLIGVGVRIGRAALASGELRSAVEALGHFERMFLVIGSAVIAGCFFAGQSIGYRGVFLLFVVPGFLALTRSAAAPTVRRLGWSAATVTLLLMWGECFRLALYRVTDPPGPLAAVGGGAKYLFWLFRELGWWWLVSIMVAILADFALRSPALHGLRKMVAGRLVRDGTIAPSA